MGGGQLGRMFVHAAQQMGVVDNHGRIRGIAGRGWPGQDGNTGVAQGITGGYQKRALACADAAGHQQLDRNRPQCADRVPGDRRNTLHRSRIGHHRISSSEVASRR